MKVFVVLALAIAAVSAGVMPMEEAVHPRDMPASDSIEGRITNGQQAREGQFPYQAGLSFSSSSGSWWCGGSIISNQWILTAAHCTHGSSSVKAYLGATHRTSAKVVHTVSSSNYIQHTSYNPSTLNNDISLIKIPALSFTSYVNKVVLPAIASSYSTYDNQQVVASGWGKISDNAAGVTNNLMYQYFNVVSVATCQSVYGSKTATPNVICIATPNKQSTCQGDSGGPLVLTSNTRLVGVTSFVAGTGCESGKPAGFTRVTSYLDWIKTNCGVYY